MPQDTRRPPQITGNIGLYYVSYELFRRGWNVMATARNARGIDIVAYKDPGEDFVGIQVKTLSKRLAVPLGASLEKITGGYWIIVNNVSAEPPDPHVFILRPEEVKKSSVYNKKSKSYWLQTKFYEEERYQGAWDRLEDQEA